jgi:hypothetical protein
LSRSVLHTLVQVFLKLIESTLLQSNLQVQYVVSRRGPDIRPLPWHGVRVLYGIA